MVRIMIEMKSTTEQALYGTLLIQDKMTSALVYSGNKVSVVSWNFLQALGFKVAKIHTGKILAANSTSMPVKGEAELLVHLKKIAPEFWPGFPMSSVHTFHCLLGLDFVTKTDCIVYAKEQNIFCKDTLNVTIDFKTNYQ